MPFLRTQFRLTDARFIAAWLLGICCSCMGCRSFCPRSLTKNVVDARQASLVGMEAMQQGRWTDAERIFAGAVKSSPEDERARGCYAETLWRRGACEQAVDEMQAAVQLSSGDAQRLVQLGEMYLSLGQLEPASRCAEQATARNCRLCGAWALQGDVAEARGQLDEALASYHRSLAYSAHQPRVQLKIAEIYQRQTRPQRALSTLETLAEQYPPGEVPADVYAAQGRCLYHLQRYHDAVEMLAKAARESTPSADLLAQLAEAQYRTGDLAGSLASVDSALVQNPSHPLGMRLKSDLESRQASALTARLNTTNK